MNYYKLGFRFMLAIVFAWTACKKAPPKERERTRPLESWFRRSVLDNQARMISLALDSNMYIAYDLENMSLYKAWKGGVFWTGAAYTNEKNVQPESWGHTYYQSSPFDSLIGSVWKIEVNAGKTDSGESIREQYPAQVKFMGYEVLHNRITFTYTLTTQEGVHLMVKETPEYKEDQGRPGLEFMVEIKGAPELRIHYTEGRRAFSLNPGIHYLYEYFDAPGVVVKPRRSDFDDHLGKYWLDRSGCNTCHEESEQTVGPSYRQISGKYQNPEKEAEMLIQKVRKGGSGNWGQVPMNPHPHLDEGAIKMMLGYIFSLDKQKVSKQRKNSPSEKSEQRKPGFGAPLEALHPSWVLQDIRPDHFTPRVGGMDVDSKGRLYLSTWDSIGAVYRLEGIEQGEQQKTNLLRIASGLHEPLGLKIVEDQIFVLQKSELTQLIDTNDDGIIDIYKSFCNGFQVSPDFHEYAYGLEYLDGYFYANLGVSMRLMSHQEQLPDRGTTIKIDADGNFSTIMTGLRQSNGIGLGPRKQLFVTENQGQWVPACKLIHVQEGTFQGCEYRTGNRFSGLKAEAPAVWLPHNEIGNSPGQPIRIPTGMYQDQLLVGEVTHGGVKRIFLEEVAGKLQGAVFRFSQGLEAGINRMVYGPDGALYVGGIGMNGNWGWKGKKFGLQRLFPSEKRAFEMLSIHARPDGFVLTFTEPIAPNQEIQPENIAVSQWRYERTPAYGGPKLDSQNLRVLASTLSPDRISINLKIDGLKEGHVVHILLPDNWISETGNPLWSGEVWYTLNHIPDFEL